MAEEPTTPTAILSEQTPEQQRAAIDHLAAIGTVASSWAVFEAVIDDLTLKLGNIPQDPGLCLTAQVSGHARKLDAYIAIARLRGADKFNGELETFAQETSPLAERRNRVVHDPWLLFFKDGAQRLETNARKKLRHQLVAMSKEDILKLANDITAHLNRFVDLHEKISAAVGTSTGTMQQ